MSRVADAWGALRLLAGGRSGAAGAVVLGYHDVVDGAARTPYDVTPEQLRMHLTSLRRWGMELVPLADLVSSLLEGGRITGKVAVTFDDALEGVRRHGLPILADLAVPFTVFAVSAELGTDPAWWPEAGRVMSGKHLLEVASAGGAIECHTRHHPSLPSLDAARLSDEVRGAKAELEDLTGAPSRLLAYPFGHHDPAVRAEAVEAGFIAGFSFVNGRVTADLDRFKLPRFTMDPRHDQLRLALHVARPPHRWPDTQADRIVGE